ncbi:MAG TPA: S53 family peptidase, partial [Holophagaceae bacterium]|nr:S53 family peptidase [Holophagaceae bacterium]
MRNRLPLTSLAALLAAAPICASVPQQPKPDLQVFNAFHAGRTIAQRIDPDQRTLLPSDIHPAALRSPVLGPVDPSFRMDRMILTFKMSPDAQARRDQLLAAQQDPKSPYFHQWLTSEQYGQLFGPSKEDVDAVATWLLGQGLRIDEVSPSRLAINFSGTAAQVQQAFRTSIQAISVDGVTRHANTLAPSIPSALAEVVAGVVSLHDIPRKAMNHGFRKLADQESDHIRAHGSGPNYTNGSTAYMAANDFKTIYNVAPLYTAGIDGTGTTIGIVGRTNIHTSDVSTFRSDMGLSVNTPTVVLNGTDPGDLGGGEETEALLDTEWSGAVARSATVKFVVSKSGSSDGVDLSAQYIVDNAATLGITVMSTSFGSCESDMGSSENTFYNNLWSQAASEGVTSFISAGDAGAAGCNGGGDTTGSGQAVNGLASTPYNVCVGGTQFNEGGNFSTYWGTTQSDYSSAKSYIPEVAWNESGTVSGGSNLWSTGGGTSTIYSKPTWQSGTGVPADGMRDCPDVSLTAASHDGYIICQGGSLGVVGGTSAASPAFAGLMALVVQRMGGTGQGNANYA